MSLNRENRCSDKGSRRWRSLSKFLLLVVWSTWSAGVWVQDDAWAAVFALQSDGKIVKVEGGEEKSFAVVRYKPDGKLDDSFGEGGKVTTRIGTDPEIEDAPSALSLQADGKIVVIGRAYSINPEFKPVRYSNDFAIVRYNPDGSLDVSFGKEGIVTTDFTAKGARPYRGPSYDEARALAIQADSKLVVGGITALARYHSDGILDTSFGTGGDIEVAVRALTLQRDGKIIVAGPEGAFTLTRYNSDGTVDASFGTEGKVATQVGRVDAVDAVAVQAEGKIVAVGSFYDGHRLGLAILRYHLDGRLDATFGSGGKVLSDFGVVKSKIPYFNPAYLSSLRWKMVVQTDGKIVVTGEPWNNLPQGFALIRYNPDGSLDTNFGTKGTVASFISAGHDFSTDLALQADGKIVVAGTSEGKFAVLRYNPDGSLDSTFGAGGKATTQINSNHTIQ